MSDAEIKPVTLTLYPNNVGISYVISQGPLEILDYGIKRITPLSESKLLKQVEKLFEYAKPTVVIVRNPIARMHKWSERKEKLMMKIKDMAQWRDLKVFLYQRSQIKEVFQQFGR